MGGKSRHTGILSPDVQPLVIRYIDRATRPTYGGMLGVNLRTNEKNVVSRNSIIQHGCTVKIVHS